MAAFPPPPGGAPHVFSDPASAGASAILRDMGEVLRRTKILAMMDPADGNKAALGAIVDNNYEGVLDSISNLSLRESSVKKPRAITEVPDAPWGVVANLNGVKVQNIVKFGGTMTKTDDVYSWLEQVVHHAAAHGLSFASASLLLSQTCVGPALQEVSQLRREGLTFAQMVQALEIRFGDLCSPEEAITRLQTCMPEKDAPIFEFTDRLRKLARQVTRNEPDAAVRLAQQEVIVRDNLIRGLPISTRHKYEERLRMSRIFGGNPPTVREMEMEVRSLEADRLQRREHKKSSDHGHRRHKAAYAAVEVAVSEDSESDQSSSEEEPDAFEYLIQQAAMAQKKYGQKNVSKERILQKAAKHFNKRYQGKGKVAEVAQGAAQGPSSKLLDAEIRRKGVYELLRMANVPTGHCIQCGIQGHRLKQDACAMKDRKLADKSCIRCGQGLHSPDECTKPIPANIQQLLEGSLNGV